MSQNIIWLNNSLFDVVKERNDIDERDINK